MDIEYILETARQTLEFTRQNLSPLFSKTSGNPPLTNTIPLAFKNIIGELEWINNQVENYVFDFYRWKGKHDERLEHTYKEIFNILKKYSTRLIVATTNYDRAIKRFSQITDYYDGFHNDKWRYLWKNGDFFYPKVMNIITQIQIELVYVWHTK